MEMRRLFLTLLLGFHGLVQAGTFEHSPAQWSALLAEHVAWVSQGVASEVGYLGFKQEEAPPGRYATRGLGGTSLCQGGEHRLCWHLPRN
ncbi:hypothetical protein D9M68_606450 [compost metagenome]